jgi:hypothetical protein
MKKEFEFRQRFQLDAFLNVPLTEKEFSMKVLHTRSFPARLIHRVRNPSAVGSRSNRKFKPTPAGIMIPKDIRSRSLNEEISSVMENLYSFLGIAPATPLPYMEKGKTPEETLGKDEIPVTNSLFKEYLRRVKP